MLQLKSATNYNNISHKALIINNQHLKHFQDGSMLKTHSFGNIRKQNTFLLFALLLRMAD